MLSLALLLCMIVTLIPAVKTRAAATDTTLDTDKDSIGKSVEVNIGTGTIMNAENHVEDPIAEDVTKIDIDGKKIYDVFDDYYERYTYTTADQYNMIRNFGVRENGTVSTDPVAGFSTKKGADSFYVNSGSSKNGHFINIGGDDGNDEGDYNVATVTVDNNEQLHTLAAGGDLEFRFNCNLSGYKDDVSVLGDNHQMVRMILTVYDASGGEVYCSTDHRQDSQPYWQTESNDPHHNKWYDSGWISLEPGYKIEIKVSNYGSGGSKVGLSEAGLYFRDLVCPQLKNYNLETNGTENYNVGTGKKEVLLKQYGVKDTDSINGSDPSYIDFALNFSEPVKTSFLDGTTPNAPDYELLDRLANHILFYNTLGTGYENAGEKVCLSLVGVTNAYGAQVTTQTATQNELLQKYDASWQYRWQTSAGNYNGNQPISGDWYGPQTFNNVYSYLDKVYLASLHDAAGNPLVDRNNHAITPDSIAAEDKDNSAGEGVLSGDIFITSTAANGGTPSSPSVLKTYSSVSQSPMSYLNFIVDAVPPTYSITSNGIQPNILSQIVLNNHDKVTFLVNFSESIIVKGYRADGKSQTGYMTEHTYLKFNNGMKAYYVSGYGSKQWTFSMTIDEKTFHEVGTLEAVALACDEHPGDTYVLTDYVGNPLVQSAGNETNRSSIAWAKLSVDNTKPQIGFTSDHGWAKSAAVTIYALDPVLSDGSESKGIYHASNTTGGTDNAKGLVYYLWIKAAGTDQDGNGVDDGVDTAASQLGQNNYAALKKYSLTAAQPEGYSLAVVNNGSTIQTPDSLCTDAQSGEWYLLVFTSDMTWDSARQLNQYKMLKEFKATDTGKTTYLDWINEYNQSVSLPPVTDESQASNDAIYYADQMGLTQVGNYDEWTSEYQSDDSNWTSEYQVVRLDNTAPSMNLDSLSGSGTADALVSISASDQNGGLDHFDYQFVSSGASVSDAAWVTISGLPVGSKTVSQTVSTKTAGLGDGTYDLYGRAVDAAGNETVAKLAAGVKVDASKNVVGQFSIPANNLGAAVKEMTGLSFSAGAARGSDRLSVTVSYAVTDSPAVPTDWTALTAGGDGEAIDGVATQVYALPDLTGANGMKYVHVLVSDSEGVNSTFYAAYKLDNTAPSVTFNPNGVAYAQESVSVTVGAEDENNGQALKYMWVKDGADVPTTSTIDGWTDFENLTILADGDDFSDLIPDGEQASFRLYVYATDEAGNAVVTASDPFLFYRGQDIAAPTGVTGALKSVYGDAAGGYSAVVQLTMPEDENPMNFEYSAALIHTDGSCTWSRWMPYESMIAMNLGSSPNLAGQQVWVKFRSSSGAVNEEADYMKLSGADLTVPEGGAVWATVSRDKLKKIAEGGTVNLALTVPDGVTASINQEGISGSGTSFSVTENGYYGFALSDGTNMDTLYVAVNNFDATPPVGSISYSTKSPTSGDVTAFLSASEDISITNNNGDPAYTFQDNGQFVFTFQDEAGNQATCTANVTWIDKTPPSATVNVGYSYTSGGKNFTFGTIKNGDSVVLAQGAVLTAESSGGKAITVVSGADTPGEATRRIRENGTYRFLVADKLGNTAEAEQEITSIIASQEAPVAALSYVDAKTGEAVGTAEIGGVVYALSPDAKAVVTLSGTVAGYAKGNRLYDGALKNNGTSYSIRH